jgi:hypothetical protein
MRARISFGFILSALLIAMFFMVGEARSEAGVVKAVLKNYHSKHQSLFDKVRHHHIMAKGSKTCDPCN